MSKNQQYAKSLIAMFEHIPSEYGAEVAASLYTEFVYATAIDSGQAALHWTIKWGTQPSIQAEIMWGWGDTPPTGFAGYKWSNGTNEGLRTELVNHHLNFVNNFGPQGTERAEEFVVYNPIEPGAFSNFAPGDDSRYFFYALGDAEAQESSIRQQAVENATSAMLSKYQFLRRAA